MRKPMGLLIASVMVLFAPVSVLALQSQSLALEPDALTFEGKIGDTLERSFTLLPGEPLSEVEIIPNDLVEVDSGLVFPADQVSISPAGLLELAESTLFTVQLQQPEQAGVFAGDLAIRYLSPGAESVMTATLPMTATIQVESAIAPAESSVNQVIRLQSIVKWVDDSGQPLQAAPASPKEDRSRPRCYSSGQGAVLVEQSETGPAALTYAGLDPLISDTRSLDGSALTISPVISETQPYSMTAGAATILISGQAPCLPPGEYTTSLRVQADNQAEPIKIALTVRSRQGVWAPVLIILIGFGAGALSLWWNQTGSRQWQAKRRLDAIKAILEDPQNGLKPTELKGFWERHNRLLKQLTSGQAIDVIETGLSELEIDIKNAQAAPPPTAEGLVADASYGLGGEFTPEEVFMLKLNLGRLSMSLLVYVFALAGGLIALYYNNPTWGSVQTDYVTLLAWALAVNMASGQSVDLGSLLQPQVQKK